MRHKGGEALASYLERHMGASHDVLMENGGIGRTPQFFEVVMPDTPPPGAGNLVRVRTVRHDGVRLIGEVAA